MGRAPSTSRRTEPHSRRPAEAVRSTPRRSKYTRITSLPGRGYRRGIPVDGYFHGASSTIRTVDRFSHGWLIHADKISCTDAESGLAGTGRDRSKRSRIKLLTAAGISAGGSSRIQSSIRDRAHHGKLRQELVPASDYGSEHASPCRIVNTDIVGWYPSKL